MFAFFRYFRLLWKPEFRHLDLPPISDPDDRIATMEFIAAKFNDDDDYVDYKTSSVVPCALESAKFRLFETCDIGIQVNVILL
jgi:hypothetical protein